MLKRKLAYYDKENFKIVIDLEDGYLIYSTISGKLEKQYTVSNDCKKKNKIYYTNVDTPYCFKSDLNELLKQIES